MGLLTRMLKETVVYWDPSSISFDEFGRPQFEDPVEFACRWEDVAEEFIDPQGTTQVSKSKVYLGQDVEVGGLLMLGTLVDIGESSFPSNPKEDDRVNEIRSFAKSPNLRATKFLRIALL